MQELFHRYFHNPERRGWYAGVNYSFNGDNFYSYYTMIGMKVVGRDGGPALLISQEGASDSTSRHINQLRRACPFTAEHIIGVPFQYGDHNIDKKELRERIISYFTEYDAAPLSRCENRRSILRRAKDARRFSELILRIPVRVLRIIDTLEQDAGDIDAKKDGVLKAIRERRAIAFEKRVKHITSRMNKSSYMDIIRGFCAGAWGNLTGEERTAIRRRLEPVGRSWSFVWLDGDQVKTSQGVVMPATMVAALINRWKAGNLEVGSHVGGYILSEVGPDCIRIGCHCIPLANIYALADELRMPATK